MIPKEGEAVWRLMDSASFYVVTDTERAGKSLVTVAVRDLDELRSTPDRFEDEPGAPRCAIFVDPDGNTLKFFADA